jgi:hypothetical protein
MRHRLYHISVFHVSHCSYITQKLKFQYKTWLYLKPGMEQTETESHGTERKKIGLKHGNGIFEHGTIKKRNKNFD